MRTISAIERIQNQIAEWAGIMECIQNDAIEVIHTLIPLKSCLKPNKNIDVSDILGRNGGVKIKAMYYSGIDVSGAEGDYTVSYEELSACGLIKILDTAVQAKIGEQKKKPLFSRTKIGKAYYGYKKRFPDCVVLFKNNSYYEIYEDDAEEIADVLDISLAENTNVRNKSGEAIRVVLFPETCLDSCLPKIVRAGYRVVIKGI